MGRMERELAATSTSVLRQSSGVRERERQQERERNLSAPPDFEPPSKKAAARVSEQHGGVLAGELFLHL